MGLYKTLFNFPIVYLNVSVQRASLGENLPAVRTDDPVDPVGDLGFISPSFYEQLLQSQIPKAQKDTNDLTELLHFWNLRA